MSADTVSWRPRPLLSRHAGRPAWLWIAAALLAFALGSATIAGVAAVREAAWLRTRLGGSATLAVRGSGLESPDAAAARAAEFLAGRKDVSVVRLLDPSPVDDVVAGVIVGQAAGTGDARLVSVALEPRTSVGEIVSALGARGIVAAVDDHRSWTAPLEHAALTAVIIAAGVVAMAKIGLFLAAGWAARQGLRQDRDRIDLMLRLGARQGFVLRLFSRRVAAAAGLAAVVGTALAMGVGLGVVFGGVDRARLLPWLPPQAAPHLVDVLAPLVWPPLFYVIGAVASALAAGAATKRLAAG